ncbi:MAG: hypothetical protein ACREV5_02510 [Steroidobacter sp.]
MQITLAAAAVLLFSCNLACAQSATPERQVKGQTVLSEHYPAVRIELPAQAQYVGAYRWTLYDVADCELHVFVEADETKRVQRLYWIQFEGYIPSRPELRYDYSENATTEFAGRTFFVNASSGEPNRKPKAGSDLEQVQRLIRNGGYSLPDHSINVRLVNLFEDDRKELMIIYAEDLQPLGVAPADLKAGGRAEKRWPELQRQIEENAKARLKVEWTGER